MTSASYSVGIALHNTLINALDIFVTLLLLFVFYGLFIIHFSNFGKQFATDFLILSFIV